MGYVLANANSESESSVIFKSPMGDYVNLEFRNEKSYKISYSDIKQLGIVMRFVVVPSANVRISMGRNACFHVAHRMYLTGSNTCYHVARTSSLL
jgi:hypothetical protein